MNNSRQEQFIRIAMARIRNRYPFEPQCRAIASKMYSRWDERKRKVSKRAIRYETILDSTDKTKKKSKALVCKWQSKLNLKEWSFTTQEILPEQVVYENDCPRKDRYFVGIEIDKQKKVGTLYHDRELTEADIIHELLHVAFPNKSEAWVNETENLISKIT